MDALANAGRIKYLTVVNDLTREYLGVAVVVGISGERVSRLVDHWVLSR